MANERKNSPTTPVRRPSGAKTTTVVSVEPATGPKISSVPLRHHLRRRLIRMQRQPPLDVLHHDHRVVDDDADRHGEPAQAHQVERVAGEREAEQRDRDGERQAERGRGAWCATRPGRAAAPAPRARRRAASRRARCRIESRTSAAWSYTDSSRTPAGSSGRIESIAARTAAWRSSVLPFGWREMLTSAAGRPLPATIWNRSCGPVADAAQVGHPDRARARSPSRPPAPPPPACW